MEKLECSACEIVQQEECLRSSRLGVRVRSDGLAVKSTSRRASKQATILVRMKRV